MNKVLSVCVAVFAAASLIYFNRVWEYTPVPAFGGEYLYQFQKAQQYAVFSANLLASPASTELPVPVVGIPSRDIGDTWGAARSKGRTHEGTDIFAKRGTYVTSATPGIVMRIGVGELGGNYVYILGPGGERYYYAHFEDVDLLLEQGQIVSTSTVLGYVGTTGNASGTPPHLHFGIYGNEGATNPYERLK